MKPFLARPTNRQSTPATYKFHRILVAVDFSEENHHALADAAELATRCEASLALVHVVEPTVGGPDADFSTPLDFDDEKFAAAKLELNDLGAQLLERCRVVETSIQKGLAFFEITQIAKTLDADLIVIGARSGDGSGIKRALLGSTAEKIIRHAPCPVLVAREKKFTITL